MLYAEGSPFASPGVLKDPNYSQPATFNLLVELEWENTMESNI